MCYLRICQTQDCWISDIKTNKFIQDVVFKDKNPNPMKQCSRSFFGVLFDLCGLGWFEDGIPYGISSSGGSHEDSFGRGGCLNKDEDARLHHALNSAHIPPYRKDTRRVRCRDPTMCPLQSVVKRLNIASVVVPDRYSQVVFNVMER